MKVMVRAIHMHIDNTKQFNYKYTIYCMHANQKKKLNCDACGEIAAVIFRKVGRIWELTEQTCILYLMKISPPLL